MPIAEVEDRASHTTSKSTRYRKPSRLRDAVYIEPSRWMVGAAVLRMVQLKPKSTFARRLANRLCAHLQCGHRLVHNSVGAHG